MSVHLHVCVCVSVSVAVSVWVWVWVYLGSRVRGRDVDWVYHFSLHRDYTFDISKNSRNIFFHILLKAVTITKKKLRNFTQTNTKQ